MNPSTWASLILILALVLLVSLYMKKFGQHGNNHFVYVDSSETRSGAAGAAAATDSVMEKVVRILCFGDSLTAGFHNRG